MSKKVSVLVPVYNAERYVAAALESVLAQSWPDIEVIAVNDGSTDGSLAVLAAYEDHITVIDQENRGAAAARNAALSRASGSHVLFFDADDLLHPEHLKSLVAALERGAEGSIAFSQWARFHTKPDEAEAQNRPTEADMTGVDWLLLDWEKTQSMLQCGMFLLPRPLLDRIGGWDERLSLCDDFEFFTRVITTCNGMIFAPQARLYYRSAIGGSLSSQKSPKAIESQYLSLMLGTSHLLQAENSQRTRRACANMLQQFIYEHYPAHPEFRAQVYARVQELGGSNISPIGPPNFHRLRRVIGWRAAKHVQKAFGR